MKLVDCNPHWFGMYGSARHGLGVNFYCPLCVLEYRPFVEREYRPFVVRGLISVGFKAPIDGGPPTDRKILWDRWGDTFETLTLSPSINADTHDHGSHKGWHGHVVDGEIRGGLP